MKNKKGFTLVELLAVVVIIAMISTLAIPNVLKMIEKGKEEDIMSVAKQAISKTKYYCRKEENKDLCTSTNKLSLQTLDIELEEDNGSYVTYDETNNTYKIYLSNQTYCIGKPNNPLDSNNLSVEKCQ